MTLFLLEDGYYNDYLMNNFLFGSDTFVDAKQQTGNLGYALWKTEEMLSLVTWIKDFNTNKKNEEKIKFYGIDSQFGNGINTIVKDYVEKNNIEVSENIFSMLDEYSDLRFGTKIDEKAAINTLNEIQLVIKNKGIQDNYSQKRELDEIVHALDVLKQFVNFVCSPDPQDRDLAMSKNVEWIMAHEGQDSKGFIWSHNMHICLTGNLKPMGKYLKELYGDAYYSVAFDYGMGTLYGKPENYNEKGVPLYKILNPPNNSYAETFIKSQLGNFFIDIKRSSKNEDLKDFFKSNKKLLMLGTDGYSPKYKNGVKQNLYAAYDGILFIKSINPPHYLREYLPKALLINENDIRIEK